MTCDQIEAKYHTLSGMSAVNLAKFYRKILLSSRPNWASWQMLYNKHNWKQLVHSVDSSFFNMHSSCLLCLGSAARTVKLKAQFRLQFYHKPGFNQFKEQTAVAPPAISRSFVVSILPLNCKYQAEINGQEIKWTCWLFLLHVGLWNHKS